MEQEDEAMKIVEVYAKFGVKPIDPKSPKKMSDVATEKNRPRLAEHLCGIENSEEKGIQRQLDFNDAASLETSRADGPLLHESRDDSNV